MEILDIIKEASQFITENPSGDFFDLMDAAGYSRRFMNGIDIEGLTFVTKTFEDVDFSDANFSNSTFIGCRFKNARFIRTNLRGTHFALCKIENCVFEPDDVIGIKFSAAKPKNSVFVYKSKTIETQTDSEFKDALEKLGGELTVESFTKESWITLINILFDNEEIPSKEQINFETGEIYRSPIQGT